MFIFHTVNDLCQSVALLTVSSLRRVLNMIAIRCTALRRSRQHLSRLEMDSALRKVNSKLHMSCALANLKQRKKQLQYRHKHKQPCHSKSAFACDTQLCLSSVPFIFYCHERMLNRHILHHTSILCLVSSYVLLHAVDKSVNGQA